MATIKDLLDRVNSLSLKDIAIDSIEETQDALLGVNQEALLDGLDKFGNSTENLRWNSYMYDKRSNLGGSIYQNRNFTNYTMNYSGRLFGSMGISINNSIVEVTSQAPYFEFYKREFPNLFGFNTESVAMDFYRANFLFPSLRRKIKEHLNL